VTIAGGVSNYAQDFGYQTQTNAGSISGTLWNDVDSDGYLDDAGTPQYFSGVTVDLYRDLNGNGKIDAGEPKMGTATTDGSGNYSFLNLPTTDNGYGSPAPTISST